ncbi:MAG: oligoendopeptidase F [Anaerobacillus sp.]|uniref:oligoendopeptidase F n=1 Tax=Anaerobacillus sp. TaxID=1872506 RepID=UPI00391BF51D
MAEQTKMKQLPKREEIPVERTWNVEDIFATTEAWEAEFKSLKEELPKLQKFKGTLGTSSDQLFQCLKYQNELSMRIGKLYVFAHLKSDQDTTNSFFQGLNDRASTLASEFSNYSSFIIPELLSMPEEKINEFVSDNDDLKTYKHALDETNRGRPHVLSEKEEAILAQVSEVTQSPANTFGMLNNADLKFPTIKDENGEDIEVTHGRYIRFLESSDPRVREDAFKAVYETYGKFKNTLASTLAGNVKKNLFNAKVRNYESARQAALDKNNIPEIVYDQLIDTINEHLHLLHRYISLRKKALKLDEIHMYDLFTPMVKDVKMEIPYEEAQNLVTKGVEPLGEEYVNIIKEGFRKRWVDIDENVGKRSGAYSSGTYGTMPYILMNWQDNVNNLFTLAHEFGHSVHSYYSRNAQPYHYSGYSIFVAEVASTCNEALLNDYLLKVTEDKKKKLYLLNHFLEGFRGTVFRQTMFAEFEKLIHDKAASGEPLTPELLTATYYDLNKKYFGDEIIIDEEIGLEWARIPHFYYNFYVYQYATGYSAATALSKQILEEGEPAVARYIEFLKAGSSDYPIEVLKRAGVDMTSADPIKEALAVFEKTLNEMEQLLFE